MVWLVGILTVICFMVILISYFCYRFVFYAAPRQSSSEIEIPEGEIYEVFREKMTAWVQASRSMRHEDMDIRSFDGLKLRGKFYEFAPGAPIELMFHGYRGTAERDMSGGIQRCFKLGRSALIVDQRSSGRSDGDVITFGINEHRDCLSWIDFVVDHFGPDVKIILTGISMGAATVMMAAGKSLPTNVVGVLADCGYNSAKDIMCKVIRQIGLPPAVCYPFAKLGAKLFGHFDLESYSPEEAMKTCTVPVIFFHGTGDDYVPHEMSRINFEACASRKKLVLIPDAGHGLSYPVDPQTYLKELQDFFGPELSCQDVTCNGNFSV